MLNSPVFQIWFGSGRLGILDSFLAVADVSEL
jgi:hypothetical protein